eukprot:gene26983-biopygen17555
MNGSPRSPHVFDSSSIPVTNTLL